MGGMYSMSPLPSVTREIEAAAAAGKVQRSTAEGSMGEMPKRLKSMLPVMLRVQVRTGH